MAILSKVQKGQPITAELFNNMIDAIRECQLNSVVGSGGTVATFKRGPGGTTISINSQGQQVQSSQSQVCPFDMTTSVTNDQFFVNVGYGLINGILVNNTNTNLSCVTSSTRYVCVGCDTNGKSIVCAGITIESSVPEPPEATADAAPENFKIVIGVVTNGVPYKTIACGNLTARVSTSIQEDLNTYAAGQRNYTQYYQWVM
jgi:hypothetical protein